MLVRVDVDVLIRNNVTASGQADGQPIVFAHGYGCDQNTWRFVVVAAALAFQHGPARDDIAVVVVTVPSAGRS